MTAARRVVGPRRSGPRRRPNRCFVERLEARLAMDAGDGVGFEHGPTDPGGDPTVGQATIPTANDYYNPVYSGSSITLHVLGNDTLPAKDPVRITAVSPTPHGSRVTIDPDGYRLTFEATAAGSYLEKFTYTITSASGKSGKAEVTVHVVPRPVEPTGPSNDWFELLEDVTDVPFHVLGNDYLFADGVIVEVTPDADGGQVRISDDGKRLLYDTRPGRYSDSFTYRVERSDGQIATATVWVRIDRRFEPISETHAIDRDSPAVTLNLLDNDRRNRPASPPRIIEVSATKFGGMLAIRDDGQRVLYQPPAGFVGDERLSYTVRYGPADHHVATGYFSITVIDPLLAVEDLFYVATGSENVALDVLANDLSRPGWNNVAGESRRLQIALVTAPSQGASIVIADGRLNYTPAAGFAGDETFTYTVVDSAGNRRQANVIVRVGEPLVDPFDRPRFRDDDELAQYLLEMAIQNGQSNFGRHERRYSGGSSDAGHVVHRGGFEYHVMAANGDYSGTNTQVAGIDEADIVETDGEYVYALVGDELLIVDIRDASQPRLVSALKLSRPAAEMYLIGDQIVLVDPGQPYTYPAVATALWLDVSDRTRPALVQRIETDGRIIDTRAIGNSVYFVVDSSITVPMSEKRRASPSGSTELWVYESLEEFSARVRPIIVETVMPKIRRFDAVGNLIHSQLLVAADDVHKPVAGRAHRITTLGVLDVGRDNASGVTTTALLAGALHQIYMAPTGVYVLEEPRLQLRGDNEQSPETTILYFRVADDSGLHLAASGSVRGRALNQFALDEHHGHLRIATTEHVLKIHPYGQVIRTENHLFVLAPRDGELRLVGSVEHLSPTQEVRAVRFMGGWAYVNTFRQVDPLLTIDLGDPANPRLRGLIEIPGFSNYLHPVGEDFLVGIGRDGDGINGTPGVPQISLFYVGDRDQPRLVDRLTMHGVTRTYSEAFEDHHAVAYFGGHGILSVPFHWEDDDGALRSAAWTFKVEVDSGQGDGTLEPVARIDHDSSVRRSLRIANALITVSDTLKAHDIDSFEALGSVYLGRLVSDDRFTIQEDAGPTILEVLANDHLPADARIASVDPVEPGGRRGTVEIAADGRSLVYTPASDFYGNWRFDYTVIDALRGPQPATVTVRVENVPDPPQAVDDVFDVRMDERQVVLDVLANDRDLDRGWPEWEWPENIGYVVLDATILRTDLVSAAQSLDDSSLRVVSADVADLITSAVLTSPIGCFCIPFSRLTLLDVSAPSRGGTVEIGIDGTRLFYTPASGFSGTETFRYTVQSSSGLTADAMVTVTVAPPPQANERDDQAVGQREPMRIPARRDRPTAPQRQSTRPAATGGIRATRAVSTSGDAVPNRAGHSTESRRLTARPDRRARLHDAALTQM